MVIECPDIDDEDGTETTSTLPLTEPSSSAEEGRVASVEHDGEKDVDDAAVSGSSSSRTGWYCIVFHFFPREENT